MKKCKQGSKHNAWPPADCSINVTLIINIEATFCGIPADSKDIMGLHKECLSLAYSVFCNSHYRMPGQY